MMKNCKSLLATVLLAAGFGTLQAQDIAWDRDKYPDYDPTPHFNQIEQSRMTKRVKARRVAGQQRPDHWNNALTNAFPPVINQDGGSCGSASRIYYMFTHEMNASRWADGSKPENIYPTHFTWLMTWPDNGMCSKEIMAQHNGIPNSVVYGGKTYSDLFGNQDCDTKDSNYGWMQGYDKWLHAMNNRISGTANFPAVNTEEGSELVKNYLWNHCGDDSFSAGGIVGVGVASGGNWKTIPKTSTNDEIGVSGMYYVQNWGASVDHALTIVGYDDRIEFDLDNNGTKGEANNSKGQNEVGAWIIVNSWGNWCNKGFIYCPYAEARPTATATGYWTPEYYTVRRDYRPLRTLKVKMDYDHRSEIALYIGVAKNLNATAPEKETYLRHFSYRGLGKGVVPSATEPDPAVPMLGKWADGDLHTEPMEFGYDLTDLVDGMDDGQPLKYFFRVETRAWAQGSGRIYNASIIDYTTDREGIEIPFDIEEEGKVIANAGAKTTITTNARYEKIPTPYNLAISGTTLSWNEPLSAPYPIKGYRIYQDNILQKEVGASGLSADIDPVGTYKVSAVYDVNGTDCESEMSAAAVVPAETTGGNNNVLSLTNAVFTVPAFTKGTTNAYTIEFCIRPTTIPSTGGFGLKASNGKFFFKINGNKTPELGFDGGDYTTGPGVSTNTNYHIAIVVNGSNMQLYINGSRKVNWNSRYNNSGLGGANDLLVGVTEGTTTNNKQRVNAPFNGYFDELRIWDYARSASEISSAYKDSYAYPMLYSHLTHYYKMDLREEGDNTFMVDAKGQHHINLTASTGTFTPYDLPIGNRVNPLTPSAVSKFQLESDAVYVGVPVKVKDLSSPSTTKWNWTATGAEQGSSTAQEPIFVFNTPGEQTITLNTTNITGETHELSTQFNVQAIQAPTADFRLPVDRIAAGEHVTFINTSTPLQEATYEWTLEGADQQTVKGINATATYKASGTYTVRLTATTAAGSNTTEKHIQVVKVAPQCAFTIQNYVAIKGEKINLIDASKFDPASWNWTIYNAQVSYIAKCQSGSVVIDRPGIYDVTLTAANEVGQNSLTRSNAITVCNADGQTGLKFDAEDDELVAPSPMPARQIGNFSIEWWMYPGTLLEKGCQMGDAASTFLLNVNADGSMNVYVKSSVKKSAVGFVIPNEWHHYAVVYSSGAATFFRDGVQFGTSVAPGSSSTKWSQFRMGGSEAPMNAIVDELRMWSTALTASKIRQIANEPIEDPENTAYLMLYYDFNQSSGDVVDHSKNGYTGVRSNFGPDGDAWSNSRGIFFLDFTSNKTNVTSTYLKNYQAPFTTGSGTVNPTASSRFKKLGSPWIQENSVVNGNVTTEFHVDTNKGSNLTLSTTWDGFANAVKNLKLYQVVTLPAGAYELNSISGSYEKNYGPNYLAVAAGKGLPDYGDLAAEALGYARCDKNCVFILNEPTEVSIGIVSNQSGQKCHTISQFALYSTEMHELEPGEIYDGIDEIREEVNAEPTLQAFGGLGTIRIAVSEPQEVVVVALNGAVIWQGFVVKQATIPARKGLYIVNHQKIIVR